MIPMEHTSSSQPSTCIFYLSHLLALFPFSQSRGLKFIYPSLLYSLTLLVLLVALFYLHVLDIRERENSNTNILLYVGYELMNLALTVTCIIAPIVNYTSIKSIIKALSEADAIITTHIQLDFKFKGIRKRQNIQAIYTISVTLLFAFIYLQASRDYFFPAFTATEFYILPVTLLVVFQLDYFTIHLRERFSLINSQLENNLQERDVLKPPHTIQMITKLDVFTLNKINRVHFILYKISIEIINVYGAQLLMMIPRAIFFCVLPLHYNIVTALVHDTSNTSSKLWNHVFTLMYIALLTSPIIYAVNVASNTVNQAKRIHILIHDLIDEDQEDLVEYELLVFSIQLLHRQIDFSVHEFFTIKPSLTTAMFELIITYVIILLQFLDTLSSFSPISLLLRSIHTTEDIYDELMITPTTPILPENITEIATAMLLNYTDNAMNYL